MAKSNNPRLKKAFAQQEYTQDQILDLQRCIEDPVYFITNHVKILHGTRGQVSFIPYNYQIDLLHLLSAEKFIIAKCARQVGKCFGENTKYTIRNKKTGEIKEIAAGEFHELCKRNS